MKQFYLLITLLVTHLITAQNFTDTKGELQISNSGSATYSLPIAMPPSIKNVAPVINLTYSSGVRGGIAGQGWNINSISTISRMATRRDIDGFVDGVDFDDNDKLALDGQRLLLKTGTYWASGSTYETEYKSNTRIEYVIQGNMTFFIVTTPDGSRTWYGSSGNGTYQNATSVNAWYIVRFEDANGNNIEYNYSNVVYNGNNQLYIDNINFSGNTTAGITAQDKIIFNYRDAKRIERDFIKGVPVYATKILDNIQVQANNVLFRKYQLFQTADLVLGYERVTKVIESNGLGEESNPVFFQYNTTETTILGSEKKTTYVNNLDFNETELAGDFDGDGRLDFTTNDKLFTKLFQGSSGQTPITLPFTASKRQRFTATTLTNNKLNQFQSIVQADETASGINFNVYNLSGNIISQSYAKSIAINNVGLASGCNTSNYTKGTNLYYEGDFNGDGISEVLMISTIDEKTGTLIYYGGSCVPYNISNSGIEYSIIDLNLNSSSVLGTSGYVKIANTSITGDAINTVTPIDPSQNVKNNKRYVADFNGDGKSDILIVGIDKTYKIISFKQLTVSPWVELEISGSGILDKYSDTKQMLFGDYNGDGKTDVMLPDTEGGSGNILWHIYYSNPNPSGGEFFVKESHNIVEYWPNTGGTFSTFTHFSSYYALDTNGDGKSDLVRVWRKYLKPLCTINDHDTEWEVTTFVNNIGNTSVTGNKFTPDYISPSSPTFCNTCFSNTECYTKHWSDSPDIPVPIVSNYRYQGANNELLMVRNHHNELTYINFTKNVDTDNRLNSVTESSGNIKQTITYAPMEAIGGGLGDAAIDFYSSGNTSVYPNIEIIKNTASLLVSKLTATINGVSKFQDFRYRGYVSNFHYGTVGFKRTSRSSWYLLSSDAKIWTTYNNDETLKGANTIIWSSTDPTTVFNTSPSALLSTKTNVFSSYTNPTTNVYNVLLNSQTTLDALTGIKSENTFTYDGTVTSANYYGLQTQSVAKQYSGTALQRTTTTTNVYDNSPTGIGTTYCIGRPKSTNNSTLIYTGDTRVSGETYTYTGTNLTKTEKTGNNIYAIVEDMTYDTVGNLLTKTVSAPAAPTFIASRTITDEYDATKRFVIKKTDHQGFATNFVYNTLGQMTKSTNYMGMISDYTFDNWGKLIQTKTTGASATPLETTISYSKLSDGSYTTTSQNTVGDQAKSITQYDVLGRAVIATTKGFAVNSLISKQVVYDVLGRKMKESEPYFSSPSQWTTYEYDYLQRPTKVITATGRVQNLSYSGLTTTSVDDGKVTTATVDALGNKIQTSDLGGIINFTYYADGQLKESDYEGHKVVISIDGWGNKIAMSDPNAGTYTYDYDAFGQTINETTPKGATINTYDNYGKLIKKKILGDGADFETTYVYNTLAQLNSEISKKGNGTPIDSFIYGYDSLKRLNSTVESNSSFIQTKTIAYDDFGRVANATNATQELSSGLSTSVLSKNNYNSYNGIMDKMTDANNAILWQLTGANEKMQSLTEALGNGVTITNTYNANNYFSSQQHSKSGINILYNTYDFNSVKGTLNSRQNLALGTSENFTYDNLDRLTQWSNPGEIVWSCNFTSGIEDFIYNGAVGSATNYIGRLKVVASGESSGTEKKLLTNASVGKKIKIKFDFEKASGNTNIRAVVVEKDPSTYEETESYLGLMTTAPFEAEYSVTTYSDVYLKFYLEAVSDGGILQKSSSVTKSSTARIIDGDPIVIVPRATFYIDNLLVNNVSINEQTYDPKGRITKNNIGTYNYNTDLTTGIYQKKSITLDPEANNYYTNLPKQTVTYTMFKSPITINESEKGATSFVYNSHLSRQIMTYGYQMPSGVYSKTKNYTDDGSVEILKTATTVTIRTYVGGDAYTAPLYIDKIKTIATGAIVDKKFYLHRDYLGSIIAISDDMGVAVERRQFDAWGNLAKLEQNGVAITLPTNGTSAGLMMMDRGYTGHEHLAEVGLIQMNGRLYDPVLRTFLMPDNFIQQPENTQNYNRYAYVLNNPLMYTDPSGEIIPFLVAIAIGAAIAATTYTLTAMLADVPFTIGGLAQATFIGAASAAVTFGIGSASSALFSNFYSQATFSALAHGTFQGTMSGIQGGKFFSSFVAGALSSIAASAWSGGTTNSYYESVDRTFSTAHQGISGALGMSNSIGMIAFGTVSGGAGAALTGGNFWQGAATGLVVSGLNHAMHPMDSEDGGPKPKSKSKTPSMTSKLHKMFDSVEEVGAWTEIGGVAAAPFTCGLSLALEPLGFWESAIGTAGNVSVDLYESYSTGDTKYLKTAAFRVTKFGITAGLGKAIDRIPGGSYMIDKTVLKVNAFIYDKVVSPRIQSRLKI